MRTNYQTVCCLSLLLILSHPGLGWAESLFRASATYAVDAPMSPRSLFTSPRPQYVGDSVTILVDEFTQQQTQFDFKTEKTQTLNANGASVLNSVTSALVNKLPLPGNLKSSTSQLLSVPGISGVDNSNQQQTKANVQRINRLRETVTCQVVQVLPNGNLIVQGRKVTTAAKERTDLFVSGIINPFFLDGRNQISSSQVGNFQLQMGGQGSISRQQNDGILTKLYQWVQ